MNGWCVVVVVAYLAVGMLWTSLMVRLAGASWCRASRCGDIVGRSAFTLMWPVAVAVAAVIAARAVARNVAANVRRPGAAGRERSGM